MEWDGYQTENIYRWDHSVDIAHSNTSNSDIGRIMMKEWQLISRHFYFLMKISAMLSLLDCGTRILYVCGWVNWLEWYTTGAYLTIVGFLLFIGFPWWLGTRCKKCAQRNVFLFGVLLNVGIGSISNVVITLQELSLMACNPNLYSTAGERVVIVISWLVLPVAALLGGVVAWMGRKWSKTRENKNAATSSKRR